MDVKIVVQVTKKEYPDLTIEQVDALVALMRDGKTEAEALELIHNG